MRPMPDGDSGCARILVADDDLEMSRVVVDVLRRRNHEVRAVHDGAALLVELARPDRFHFRDVDLVIADVRMPVCSGLQALRAVRDVHASVPFLLLTAFGDEATHADARRLGARMLDKPVSMSRLCAVVDELLAEHPRCPTPAG